MGNFMPQTPYRGIAPGPHWGTSATACLHGKLRLSILNRPAII